MLLSLLVSLTEKFYDKSGPVLVDKGKCVHGNKGFKCLRCMEVCKSNLIEYDEDEGITVDDNCTGCTKCTHICMTGAITDPLQPRALRIRGKSGVTTDIYCERVTKLYGVKTKCVFNLTLPQLLELYSREHKKLNFICMQCLDCSKTSSEDISNKIKRIKQWNQLLEKPWINITMDKEAYQRQEQEITRDEFFKIAKEYSKGELTDYLPNYTHVKNTRNFLLSLSMDRLGEQLKIILDGKNFNDKCQVCGKCEKLCPTGAINYEETNMNLRVSYNYLHCVNCSRCINYCPCGGIERSNNFGHSKEIIGSKCIVCGSVSNEYRKICAKCQNKRKI